MIIYPEQVRTFFDGRDCHFRIRIFCNGTYDFKATTVTGEPRDTVRSLDIAFVNCMVAYMKGREPSEIFPHFPIIEIDTIEQGETAS